ncbi:hypothetical protein [Cyanobium sp. Copco_Reservoir_LC18]|uniref:hypothetical protein n=1 Tax=Cyanobium sp. Copco_Reservoir_LC18 TaxID=1328305 RepID=UPI001F3430EE|nr:hypothetical protein [Cyanobium sp. Copco_Reservoir_LC18]
MLYDVTSAYDCPLMVTSGYPSLSYLRSAAETMVATGKPVVIYYFGDYDPSGADISRNIEDRLEQFLLEVNRQRQIVASFPPDVVMPLPLRFEQVAVNEWQIDGWNLPTRPTKKTDSRAAKFGSRSVEVDAIPPDGLRQLVRSVLSLHISETDLAAADEVDAMERQTLASAAERLRAFAA